MESNSYGFCLKGCEGSWKGPRCAKKAATGLFTETSYIHNSNNRHCCSIRISFFPEKDREQFSALAAERILFVNLLESFLFHLSVSETIWEHTCCNWTKLIGIVTIYWQVMQYWFTCFRYASWFNRDIYRLHK